VKPRARCSTCGWRWFRCTCPLPLVGGGELRRDMHNRATEIVRTRPDGWTEHLDAGDLLPTMLLCPGWRGLLS
jgi:hypothetical protein